MKVHVLPVFGSAPINEMRRKELKLFFDKQSSDGVASNTVALICSPISGVLSHALDSELIEHNPTVGLKLEKGSASEFEPLLKAERQTLSRMGIHKQQSHCMLRYKTFKRALMECLKLAKLRKIRIHDLRHTYATIRLLSDHNIGDVSYQLGHSSINDHI